MMYYVPIVHNTSEKMLFNKGFYKVFAMLLALLSVSTSANVAVSDAFIRAPIPGTENTAAYMTLSNKSDVVRVLVAAKSNIADKVEFHDHIMANGTMRMVKKERLEVPANSQLTFQSGGLHVMFIGLRTPVEKSVEVSFEFQNGDVEVVTLPVRSVHHEHHHH